MINAIYSASRPVSFLHRSLAQSLTRSLTVGQILCFKRPPRWVVSVSAGWRLWLVIAELQMDFCNTSCSAFNVVWSTCSITGWRVTSSMGPLAVFPLSGQNRACQGQSRFHCHFRGLIMPRRCFLGANGQGFLARRKPWAKAEAGARGVVMNKGGVSPASGECQRRGSVHKVSSYNKSIKDF